MNKSLEYQWICDTLGMDPKTYVQRFNQLNGARGCGLRAPEVGEGGLPTTPGTTTPTPPAPTKTKSHSHTWYGCEICPDGYCTLNFRPSAKTKKALR